MIYIGHTELYHGDLAQLVRAEFESHSYRQKACIAQW